MATGRSRWLGHRSRGKHSVKRAEAGVIILDSDEHAWWAARSELQRVYVPPPRAAAGGRLRGAFANDEPLGAFQEDEPLGSAFEEDAPRRDKPRDYWSTESLFTWADSVRDCEDRPASVVDVTDP
jgi:hypothetical protein